MSTQVAVPVSLDVRMVLASRRARIVPSPVCVSRVRRCLFGLPSDPEQALAQAAQELKRQTEADAKRWNFDFAHEKPLPGGQFVWQAQTATDAADHHHQQSSAAPMRQSHITEFLQSRKRVSSGSLVAANNKRTCIRSTTPACDASRT